ncbi:hypothetical protein ACFZBM_35165 [Streptomyces lavendulae]|uniref:Uncharacterized protein n=1 Tax=Streptomyces lavendulae subsp. lavendulae TaxID=58340 RepID=A0A2K8PHH1_STRLA|nr:hypothetical protein [Streptomyces lavendulae]ATZ26177.1 hypothetical protein SLAV_21800 [Streptomyces lavendulae subsp. lavendulae]QUQ56006.1 hypothetical protein SLLC_19910 [Streptomyces lavendulae subsp. lavendulae]
MISVKTSFPRPGADQAWIRKVAGSVLAAAYLLDAAAVCLALGDGRSAPSDRDGLGAAGLACLLSVCLSIGAIQLCLRPSVRRALGLWWTTPAVVLGAVASVRLAVLF